IFRHPRTSETSTLSLHDALPILVDANAKISLLTPTQIETTWTYGNIWIKHRIKQGFSNLISIEWETNMPLTTQNSLYWQFPEGRSEEHTSELQSRENLVCRLLLE